MNQTVQLGQGLELLPHQKSRNLPIRETPRDCARAMTDGYKQFMVVKKAEAKNSSASVPG